MGNIRKQTIISSLLIYIGFFIGAINTYLYIKQGGFTTEQSGLTRLFFDIGVNFYTFGSLGLIPILQKFYPYYKDNLQQKNNDLFSWIFLASIIGFILVSIIGYYAKPLIVRKFTERSAILVDYYYYIMVFAFGMLLFSLLEALSWCELKTIMPNFLKETGLRIATFIFVVLFSSQVISFKNFIFLFTTLYFIIALCMVFYLKSINKLHFTFSVSRVTKKFFKKIWQMQSLVFGGLIIMVFGQTMDSIFIASLKGIGFAGVYGLAQYGANLIQVPQRSMQSIVTGILSQAWKDKNYTEINRIYKRSSINMLLMALFIFGFILLNIQQLFVLVKVQEDFMAAIILFSILGLVRVIDAGTGVNNIIIGTSTFWKFEFFSGIVMIFIRFPLAYILIKQFGPIGAAFSELTAITIYNGIRFYFLKSKFNFQPFSYKTVLAIIAFVICYTIAWLLPQSAQWIMVVAKSFLFSALFIAAIYYLKLTPDFDQLAETIKKKIKANN